MEIEVLGVSASQFQSRSHSTLGARWYSIDSAAWKTLAGTRAEPSFRDLTLLRGAVRNRRGLDSYCAKPRPSKSHFNNQPQLPTIVNVLVLKPDTTFPNRESGCYAGCFIYPAVGLLWAVFPQPQCSLVTDRMPPPCDTKLTAFHSCTKQGGEVTGFVPLLTALRVGTRRTLYVELEHIKRLTRVVERLNQIIEGVEVEEQTGDTPAVLDPEIVRKLVTEDSEEARHGVNSIGAGLFVRNPAIGRPQCGPVLPVTDCPMSGEWKLTQSLAKGRIMTLKELLPNKRSIMIMVIFLLLLLAALSRLFHL